MGEGAPRLDGVEYGVLAIWASLPRAMHTHEIKNF
jgi:hypothetical protein